MVLTKEAFLNHLYGGMDEPEVKIIDVFVCKLRKKLARAGAVAGRVTAGEWCRARQDLAFVCCRRRMSAGKPKAFIPALPRKWGSQPPIDAAPAQFHPPGRAHGPG